MSRIITFYSYKGGTGRSMALANVAWILASAGKRVLTIDWDLEAPGLHRYFHPFLIDKELSGQGSQGVIDMVIDFAVRAATPTQGETLSGSWYEAYADFSKWQQKLRWPSGEAVQFGTDGRGEIDFVPAGRQSTDYAKRVNNFDWHSFYEKLGGGAFFDAAKRKFALYDYVLIDSRTGVSDTSGICTVHLPDTLVVCFTLNFQSIKGAAAVAQSVKDQRPEMRFLPVPMRIDGGEEKSLNRMKSYAADVFTPFLGLSVNQKEYWFSMEVPYHPRYAYAEKLALFEEQASITASTLPAMVRLSGYITVGEVQTAGPLPDTERGLVLAEFEGVEPSKGPLAASPTPVDSVLAAYREGHLDQANFSGANLSGLQLPGASLVEANLSGANLREADLTGADLGRANLSGANLSRANLRQANLSGANLSRANLRQADLSAANLNGVDLDQANLSGADLSGADLYLASLSEADLTSANLSAANLRQANLYGANLRGSNLIGADLAYATLVSTVLTGANLSGARIYGLSAWDVKLEGAKQQNLVITPEGVPSVTVDNIQVGQFIYLMLNNQNVREVIDSIPSKMALILGRFTDESKAILDALREELRKRGYVPILFDFDVPATRDTTETISLLARMARFIIAELTDPSGIPRELEAIVPHIAVPVQPLLQGSSRPYAMFTDYRKYDWVLPVYRYEGLEQLLGTLAEGVIAPAEAKVKALEERRRMIEAELTKESP